MKGKGIRSPKKNRRGTVQPMANRDPIPGLAARLVAARTAAGLNQTSAAARSGVHRVNLAAYERERMTPTVRAVYLLARAYGVPVADLLPPVEEVLPPREGEGEAKPKGK